MIEVIWGLVEDEDWEVKMGEVGGGNNGGRGIPYHCKAYEIAQAPRTLAYLVQTSTPTYKETTDQNLPCVDLRSYKPMKLRTYGPTKLRTYRPLDYEK